MRKERYSVALIAAAFLSGMFMTAMTSAWDDRDEIPAHTQPAADTAASQHVASNAQRQTF